jgi:hypothetical protein
VSGFVVGILRTLLLEAAAILVLAGPALRRGGVTRTLSAVYLGLAALSFVAFTNFGDMHGRGQIVHWTEQYHFDLGDKYLRAVRYDGLYLATDAALAESGQPTRQDVRDTVSFQPIPTSELPARIREVRARFSDGEWKGFTTDLASMLHEDPYAMNLMDHGNTASPSESIVPWLLMQIVPLRGAGFRVLAWVDVAILVLLFAACWRWGSLPVACLALMPALLAPRVTDFLMGSLFRMDWLVTAAAGTLALHRRRYALAGGLLAYATLSRPFAAAFALGAAIGLAGEVLRGRRSTAELMRFAAGGAATALGLAIVASVLFGWHIWPEYGARMLATVREGYYGINHGFRDLYAQATVEGPGALLRPVPRSIAASKAGVLEGMQGLATARVLLGLLIGAVCLLDGAVFGAGLGVFFAFALTVTNTYYQNMWAVFGLACAVYAPQSLRARMGMAAVLGMFGCRYVFEHFGELRYAQDYYASWTTFAFLVGWCTLSLASQLHRRRAGDGRAFGAEHSMRAR